MSLAVCISANSAGDIVQPHRAHHWIGADRFQAGEPLREAIDNEITVGLFESDRLVRHPALLQKVGHELQRILVFIPRPDFRRNCERLANGWTFKEGRDDDRVALCRDHCRGEPLGAMPLNAREIIEAGARFDDHRADPVLLHQSPRAGDPLQALSLANGRRQRDWNKRLGCSSFDAAQRHRHGRGRHD